MEYQNSSTSVVVKLELGHQASLRSHPTQDGFTHDWTVFVRGIEGSGIHHFVDKVVFYLHESFPKPKRVVKEPPYQVSESGYAGFIMPVEVYFKNKEEPKKVKFEYDLYLRLEGPPVNHVRYEKLTFQNPVDDFRRKLLKAGGIGSVNTNGGNTATVQTHSSSGHAKSDNSIDNQKLAVTKVSAFHGQEKKKQHSVAKECNAAHQSNQKVSAGHKSLKTSANSHSSGSTQNLSKDSKSGRPPKEKFLEKDAKEQKHSKTTKYYDKDNKQSSVKRYSSPTFGQNSDSISGKKRPRSTSTSSENSSIPSNAGDKKDLSKVKNKEVKTKEKHKSKSMTMEEEGKAASKKERSKEKSKVSKHRKALNDVNKNISLINVDNQKMISKSQEINGKERCDAVVELHTESGEKTETTNVEDTNSSPSSSLSLSPVPPGGSHGPLATMMAEMEKDLLSPLSSDPGSPAHPDSPADAKMENDRMTEEETNMHSELSRSAREEAEVTVKSKKEEELATGVKREETSKVKKDQERVKTKKEEGDNNGQDNCGKRLVKKESDVDVRDEWKQSSRIESSYLKELRDLQKRIMSLRDRRLLQKIVDVIEETGKFNISRSSFDFDLCLLDQTTVRKLQNCLTVK